MECNHGDIRTITTVTALGGSMILNVRASCSECGEPFSFSGVAPGHSTTEPTSSGGGLIVRLPVEPATARNTRCAECDCILWGLPSNSRATAIECGPAHMVTLADGRRYLMTANGAKEEKDDDNNDAPGKSAAD